MTFLTGHQSDALRTLREHWDEDEIVIVGAAALRYLLGHEWRETDDLDLSIASSVKDCSAVLAGLADWERDSRTEQRWIAPHGVRIDIIPASAELIAAGEVVWPESDFRMSLRGFGLAFEYGEPVGVGGGASVLVAPVPAIFVLKMSAYLDRPAERERDLGDLAAILERGVCEDDEDRYTEQVFAAGLTYEEAGPFVLGQRVAAIVGENEERLVSDFIKLADHEDQSPFLLERLARSGPASWNRAASEARVRLKALALGMGLLR